MEAHLCLTSGEAGPHAALAAPTLPGVRMPCSGGARGSAAARRHQAGAVATHAAAREVDPVPPPPPPAAPPLVGPRLSHRRVPAWAKHTPASRTAAPHQPHGASTWPPQVALRLAYRSRPRGLG